ncbi:hypothetical protein F8S20_02570 [Nostoc sp. BAE]|nr:hypothetical protein [Nostoc commune BAE]
MSRKELKFLANSESHLKMTKYQHLRKNPLKLSFLRDLCALCGSLRQAADAPSLRDATRTSLPLR